MKRRTVITIVAFGLVTGAWYYIKTYTKLLSKYSLYTAYYDDVKGMQESSTVYLKGVKVGKVKSIDLHSNQQIEVTFAINENLRLPKGTAAVIGVGDFTGNKSVHLDPGPGPGFVLPNEILIAGFDTTMIENFDAKISPVLHNGKILLRNADSALHSFNSIIHHGLGERAQEDIGKFNNLLGDLSKGTGEANMRIQHIHPTITKLDSTLKKPGDINDGLNKSLVANDRKTSDAAKKEMHKDLEEAKASINKLTNSFSNLNRKKIFSDTEAYTNASRSLDTFSRSIQEYQTDPPSPIKIFSGKKK